LIVIDSLNLLASEEPRFLPAFLSGVISITASVVAVYHTDVPLVLPSSYGEYEPHPLTLLSHLATAIFRLSSLYQAIERRKAQNKSLPEPEWGLREGREGVLIGVKTRGHENRADEAIIEMEMRRRSGREVAEKFVLATKKQEKEGDNRLRSITLLSDHPLFAPPDGTEGEEAGGDEADGMDTTFNLGLTEKQRKDREGVVLPYFDAQEDVGAGEGGRILYDMGREDDFDDEEDEI
jgi:elongator complex protein 5